MKYAELNKQNIVERLIVADEAFVAKLEGAWLQVPNGMRCGKGYTYDPNRNAFVSPKPYPSWILSETTNQWEAPVARPEGMFWRWSEADLEWVSIKG